MTYHRYGSEIGLIATMHGKERVMGPILEQELGLRTRLADGLDTDRFGTFSHDIERTGSPLDAARAKIAAAFALHPQSGIALASEGSFGPHPQIPFLAMAREIVVFVDRLRSLRIIGHDETSDTNFAHAIVTRASDAMMFAEKMGFPGHGVIVMGCQCGRPAPASMLETAIVYGAELERAVRAAVERCGAAYLEADMRAHRNPRRMRAIERATMDLVARFRRRCPVCERPDFSVVERIPGLPCADCNAPTYVVQREASICRGCGYRSERAATERSVADPDQCERCNPCLRA